MRIKKLANEKSPLNRMYNSFNLFGKFAENNSEFSQLSVGVNLIDACSSILECLHMELNSGLTYRNYGRSSGLVPITNALEFVENTIANSINDLAVTITNGTTDGAHSLNKVYRDSF